MKQRRTLLTASTLLFVLLAGLLASQGAFGWDVPKPQHVRGLGDACVEPTDVMRRRHMEFITHQRDRTVHDGIRTPHYSLAVCIDCHVAPETGHPAVSHKDDQHFCNSCHSYTGVTIDCFSCHADRPMKEGRSPFIPSKN